MAGVTAPPATLPDGLPMDYILDPEDSCNGFRQEQGEERAEHFPPDRFTLDELVAMYEFTECPLHTNPDYPLAPEGVWKRDYHLASCALGAATRRHVEHEGCLARHPCRDDGCSGCGDQVTTYVVTATELREVFESHPHARWCFEREGEAGRIKVQVTDG